MKITGMAEIEIEVTDREITHMLFAKVREMLGLDADYDDAGCDWQTDGDGRIIIGHNSDWVVARYNVEAVVLVDAANILLYGCVLSIDTEPTPAPGNEKE